MLHHKKHLKQGQRRYITNLFFFYYNYYFINAKQASSKSIKSGDDELESLLDDLVANPKDKQTPAPKPVVFKPKAVSSSILNKPTSTVTPAPVSTVKVTQQEKVLLFILVDFLVSLLTS